MILRKAHDVLLTAEFLEGCLYWSAAIAQKAYKLIEQVAEQGKLDAMLAESAWVSPRIDITDKILKLLDK